MAKGHSQSFRGAAAQASLRSLRKLGCVAASPESITTAGDHGFRAPSLRSGPGMTSELSNARLMKDVVRLFIRESVISGEISTV
jgi:hypothetical protein